MSTTETINGDDPRIQFTNDLVSKLNPKQREAVTIPRSSALVLAGAGSGKTSVLIARIANLINWGLDPSTILAVTFTNKSAKEMQERLRQKVSREAVNAVWSGTFHSICSRILRVEYEAAGLPKNFAILDTDAQKVMIKTLIKDIYGDKNSPVEDDGDEETEKIKPKEVVAFINNKKEFGIRPEDVDFQSGSDVAVFVQLYYNYQEACRNQGLLDFSDLLYRTVELFEQNPHIHAYYTHKFSAILVDEFQDTNDIQYRWLQLLKGPDTSIMAVGDDDQSIYAFRGANPTNMQRFVREMTISPKHPEGHIIKLEQNYRSLPYILKTANSLIARNSNRLGKDLWSDSQHNNEKIELTEYENATSEAKATAKAIHSLIHEDKVPASEIAILYRTNMQSRLLEQELNKLNVPSTVYGGFRFFEREEIKHVLAYMDLVSSFDRDISFARVINVPGRGLGGTTIEDLRQDAKERSKSMLETIALRADEAHLISGASKKQKQRKLEDFALMVIELCEQAAKIKLAQLIEKIVEVSGLKAMYEALPSEEASERLSNISELISAAKQFEVDRPELTNAHQQLAEYLTFVQLMSSTSEADMDKKNTVSLMTVHSAKGLEFDNVFIAGLEEGTFPHQRSIADNNGKVAFDPWGNDSVDSMQNYDDSGHLTAESVAALEQARIAAGEGTDTQELQEERRLMYVALTRARKHLHISFAKERMVNGESKRTEPSRFLSELLPQFVQRKQERPKRQISANENSGNGDFGDDDFGSTVVTSDLRRRNPLR